MALLIKATYPEPLAVFQPSRYGPRALPLLPIGAEVKPARGTTFSLSELQTFVGGYIEVSHFPDGRYLVSNENGKIDRLPVNVEATMIYREAWKAVSEWAAHDTIVGDVLLCQPGEIA